MDQVHRTIELFGYKLELKKRTMGAIIEVDQLVRSSDNDDIKAKFLADAYSLENALRSNIEKLKWWNIIKWISYKRKLNAFYFLTYIQPDEMAIFMEELAELEGISKKDLDEVKKK